MRRAPLFGLAFAMSFPAGSAAAAPGEVQKLSAKPLGLKVDVTIAKTGKDCGVEVRYTNVRNAPSEVLVLSGPSKTVSHTYPAAGSHSISVYAKATGGKPACGGQLPMTVGVSVKPLGGSPGKARDTPTRMQQDNVRTRPSTSLGAADPKTPALAPPRLAAYDDLPRPEITKITHGPPAGGGIPGHPDMLVPGSKLSLNGQHFGSSPGEVVLAGLPGGPVELERLFWAPTSVIAQIPASLKTPYGTPLGVKIHARRATAPPQTKNSVGTPQQFETPGEFVVLPRNSPGGSLVDCGSSGAEQNYCNHAPSAASDFSIQGEFTFTALHWDEKGDPGTDEFRVRLKNGWVIHEVVLEWHRTTDASWIMAPNGATLDGLRGRTDWSPSVKWKVNGDDTLWYGYRVVIVGPPGTRWF